MEEIKKRVKLLLDEIEYVHLKKKWLQNLVEAGADEEEARIWVAEIGHVVDEYRTTLEQLTELLGDTDIETVPTKIHDWAVGISEVTVPEIQEPMRYLEGQLKKYVPDDDLDEV